MESFSWEQEFVGLILSSVTDLIKTLVKAFLELSLESELHSAEVGISDFQATLNFLSPFSLLVTDTFVTLVFFFACLFFDSLWIGPLEIWFSLPLCCFSALVSEILILFLSNHV